MWFSGGDGEHEDTYETMTAESEEWREEGRRVWWAEGSQVCWNKHLGQRGGAPSRTSTVRHPPSEQKTS